MANDTLSDDMDISEDLIILTPPTAPPPPPPAAAPPPPAAAAAATFGPQPIRTCAHYIDTLSFLHSRRRLTRFLEQEQQRRRQRQQTGGQPPSLRDLLEQRLDAIALAGCEQLRPHDLALLNCYFEACRSMRQYVSDVYAPKCKEMLGYAALMKKRCPMPDVDHPDHITDDALMSRIAYDHRCLKPFEKSLSNMMSERTDSRAQLELRDTRHGHFTFDVRDPTWNANAMTEPEKAPQLPFMCEIAEVRHHPFGFSNAMRKRDSDNTMAFDSEKGVGMMALISTDDDFARLLAKPPNMPDDSAKTGEQNFYAEMMAGVPQRVVAMIKYIYASTQADLCDRAEHDIENNKETREYCLDLANLLPLLFPISELLSRDWTARYQKSRYGFEQKTMGKDP